MRYHILISTSNSISAEHLVDRNAFIDFSLEQFSEFKRVVTNSTEIDDDLKQKIMHLNESNYKFKIFKNLEIIRLAEFFPDFKGLLIDLPLKELKNSFKGKNDKFIKDVSALSDTLLQRFIKMQPSQKKQLIASLENYPVPFYLYDESSMKNLISMFQEGDTLVLHGEGAPMVAGLDVSSRFDLYPGKLADILEHYNFDKKKFLQIEFLTCNGATTWHGINFTQLTAQSLRYCHGFEKAEVVGYSAYVVEKGQAGKFSACLQLDEGRRAVRQNCSLEDCREVYKDGVLIKSALKSADLNELAYDWAKYHISQIEKEKKQIFAAVVNARAFEYLRSLPLPESQEEWESLSHLIERIETLGIVSALPEILEIVAHDLEWEDLLKYQKYPVRMSDDLKAYLEFYKKRVKTNTEATAKVLESCTFNLRISDLLIEKLSLSHFSLWALRDETGENRERFDRQFGLTMFRG